MTKRTPEQNKALNLWFRRVAEAFTENGLDMQALMKAKSVSVPVTEEMVKKVIWKPIQELMFGTKSTTDLNTDQVGVVYEVINRHFANSDELNHIHVPFPSIEEQLNNSLIKDYKQDNKG